MNEHQIYSQAINWVIEAGEIIRSMLKNEIGVRMKASHADLVTAVDREVETFIVEKIKKHYPEHNIIGEESIGNKLSGHEYMWIIDPIDGTTNMINRKQDFAVSVAFCSNNTGVFGIVYDVMNDRLYRAFNNEGAYLNQTKLKPLDSTHLEKELLALNLPWNQMEKDVKWNQFFKLAAQARGIRIYGATTIELCDMAVGKLGAFVQCFIKPWDYAACRIILTELGCKFTDLEGNEIDTLYDGGIMAATAPVHKEMLEILRK